ncbi:MAG: hypothetical protein FWD76_00455 [Firmicutes bacterium]|nr:hypothetical protein [Bacillota bacterium]
MSLFNGSVDNAKLSLRLDDLEARMGLLSVFNVPSQESTTVTGDLPGVMNGEDIVIAKVFGNGKTLSIVCKVQGTGRVELLLDGVMIGYDYREGGLILASVPSFDKVEYNLSVRGYGEFVGFSAMILGGGAGVDSVQAMSFADNTDKVGLEGACALSSGGVVYLLKVGNSLSDPKLFCKGVFCDLVYFDKSYLLALVDTDKLLYFVWLDDTLTKVQGVFYTCLRVDKVCLTVREGQVYLSTIADNVLYTARLDTQEGVVYGYVPCEQEVTHAKFCEHFEGCMLTYLHKNGKSFAKVFAPPIDQSETLLLTTSIEFQSA